MKAKLISIAVGKSKTYKFSEKVFESAYKKDDFLNTVQVTKLGLVGDFQVDKRFHGGVDKAIHFGAIKHLEKNEDFDKLAIGCNIFVDSFDEEDICLGDNYKIGEVELEVTQPRHPCWKIGALFGKEVSRYISKNSATGWYVRVLKEGNININDEMILTKRVSDITIRDLSSYISIPPSSRKIIDEILNSEVIGSSYKKDFFSSLEKNNS